MTSETVVDDVEVHHQRDLTHRVRKVGRQLDIPTMSTPFFSNVFRPHNVDPWFSNVFRLGVMCGVERVWFITEGDFFFIIYFIMNQESES